MSWNHPFHILPPVQQPSECNAMPRNRERERGLNPRNLIPDKTTCIKPPAGIPFLPVQDIKRMIRHSTKKETAILRYGWLEKSSFPSFLALSLFCRKIGTRGSENSTTGIQFALFASWSWSSHPGYKAPNRMRFGTTVFWPGRVALACCQKKTVTRIKVPWY